jgi:hypothetical protein
VSDSLKGRGARGDSQGEEKWTIEHIELEVAGRAAGK